jgi:hypothetical protein
MLNTQSQALITTTCVHINVIAPSLILFLLNTLAYLTYLNKLTYVCRLLNKNLVHNIGYLVSYLTRHKKFTTSNMFKYNYNRLPY